VPAGSSEQFAARESGATAGVASEDGQSVFASSQAPNGKSGAGSQAAGSGTPSESSAVGDAWSGFSSGTAAGTSSAGATSLGEAGSGSTLGMVILGLGLAGLLGTFLVLAAPRRRRAEVGPRGSSRRDRGESGR